MIPANEKDTIMENMVRFYSGIDTCLWAAADDAEHYSDFVERLGLAADEGEVESARNHQAAVEAGIQFLRLFREYVKEEYPELYRRLVGDA